MSRVLMLLFVFAGVAAAEGPKVVEGQLTQAEVERVLDLGPQRLIAGVEVAAHRARVAPDAPAGGKGADVVQGPPRRARFVGFRIVSISPTGPLAEMQSIQVGDVVITVNGQPVERPDDFMKVWEGVRGRDTLEVRVLRGVEPIIYRWKVVAG